MIEMISWSSCAGVLFHLSPDQTEPILFGLFMPTRTRRCIGLGLSHGSEPRPKHYSPNTQFNAASCSQNPIPSPPWPPPSSAPATASSSAATSVTASPLLSPLPRPRNTSTFASCPQTTTPPPLTLLPHPARLRPTACSASSTRFPI
jgi:hypothetical protein